MHLQKHLAIVTLLLVVVRSTFADTPASTITLDEAVNAALAENRDIAAARFVIREAEGRLKQAGLWPNPELELSRTTDVPFHDEGEYTESAAFKQRFPFSGRIAEAKSVARLDVALAEAEVRDRERLLIGEVVGHYRGLLVISEKLRTNEELEHIVQQLVDVTQRRLKVAEVSPADLNLEKLELQKLLVNRSELAIERDTARIALNELLGREPQTALEPAEAIEIKLDKLILHDSLDQAVMRRPDRAEAALQIDRAVSEIGLAEAESWEDWTIGVGYDHNYSVFDSSVIGTQTDDFLGLSLSVPLPLWNRNEGQISAANASKGKARAQLAALDLKIMAESQDAENQVRRFYAILEQYRHESIKLAEDNVHLLQKSYAEGIVGITSLIQAQQQLRELRQSYAEAVGSYLRALTEFETVTASSPYLK